MRSITLDALEADAADYDAAVDAADLPDRFCTSSAWVLPAFHAFLEDAEPALWRGDDGWLLLQRLATTAGPTLAPLEASWGLASPLVGPQPVALARAAAAALQEVRGTWSALFLSGLTRGGPLFTALVHAFGRRHRMGIGQPAVRVLADLQGGVDGFLGRRARTFRKALRQEVRAAAGELTLERHAPTDVDAALALFGRAMAVEATSWKGVAGHGVHDGAMRAFYADMVPRLTRQGALRLTLVRRDGADVGYCLGGVRGDVYRGLQISFAAELRHLAPGKLMHLHTIEGLVAEGVRWYDLGTDMPYKRAWGETLVETVPLVVR